MSTSQRTHVQLVPVDPSTIDVLRRQTLIVLEDHHHCFEDLLDLSSEAQHALAEIFRDAFAVLDAIGWAPAPQPATDPIDVPLTAGHVERLHHRRHDLGATNLDRLDRRDATADSPAELDEQITADRRAAQALDRLFDAWAQERFD